MKILYRIIAIIEIAFGLLFLVNYASDIQIGFGLVMVFGGSLALIKA